MNMIKGHLKKLEGFGDYRIAMMTASANAEIDEMTKMTDTTSEESYISSGRIVIHVNPNVLGAFAAKVAYTPYYKTLHINLTEPSPPRILRSIGVMNWKQY